MEIPELEPGSYWGPNARFEILKHLGSGSFANVYEAVDHLPEEGRELIVALKILKPWLREKAANWDEIVENFRREAEILKGLDHPHVPRIFAKGEFDGTHWAAYGLIPSDAETLMCFVDRQVKRGEYPPLLGLCHVFLPVASALQHAHRRGVVHGDISPNNLMVESFEDDSSYIWVVDWGSAQRTGDTLPLGTRGTRGYVAPTPGAAYRESVLADARDDQYSLAAIIARMVLGLGWEEVLKPQDLLSDTEKLRVYPLGMRAALARALSERREDRFPSVEQFMADGFLPYAPSEAKDWFEDRSVDEQAKPGEFSRSIEKEIAEAGSSQSPLIVRAAVFATFVAAVAKAVWEIIGL